MAKLDNKIVLISGGTSGSVRRLPNCFSPKARQWSLRAPASARWKPPRRRYPGSRCCFPMLATWPLPRVDQVKAKHGRIDVLFVNAGIAKFAPIAQVDEAFYDSQFNINVKGAFFLVKHAIPVIPDGGAIILTASVAGANGGLGGSAVYGSTKAALRSFGRTIAKELTPRGIRVNTITVRSSPQSSTKAASHRLRRTTLSRGPRPAFRSAAPAPPPKSPLQPSTSPPMPPTPLAPNCSSTAA
jgi:Enoyl-(Acyl carrier protein) reductase